jgi:NOL1/NOP2/sun family putative RNA methylase
MNILAVDNGIWDGGKFRISSKFESRYREILGNDYEKLLSCLNIEPKNCIRINILKVTKEYIKSRLELYGWTLEDVPWFKNALFVNTDGIQNEELTVGKTLEHMLGYFYTQDGSSLVPAIVLDPKPGEKVLDLCAAPGSKTTQMAAMMQNKGIIVANDKSIQRTKALRFNLQRCGVINTIVTTSDGRVFWKNNIKFDKILVDVPCTGTGKIIGRQGLGVLKMWRKYMAERLSRLQRKLLESAILCLEKNGCIVYSTCSLDPEENENVVNYVIKKYNMKIEKIKIKGLKFSHGMVKFKNKEFVKEMKNAIRIYPWQNQTEGFFVCKLTF